MAFHRIMQISKLTIETGLKKLTFALLKHRRKKFLRQQLAEKIISGRKFRIW